MEINKEEVKFTEFNQETIERILKESFEYAVEKVFGEEDSREAARNWAHGFHGNLPRYESDILAFRAGARWKREHPQKEIERLKLKITLYEEWVKCHYEHGELNQAIHRAINDVDYEYASELRDKKTLVTERWSAIDARLMELKQSQK